MSAQAVMNFILKVAEDKTLNAKVSALPSDEVDGLINIARAEGFEFTAEEFVNTVLEASRKSGELKEDDLEQVAGGALNAYLKFESISTDSLSLNFTRFVKI